MGYICIYIVACVVQYHARHPVSRDTALHKQLEVIQPSRSKHCSRILYLSKTVMKYHERLRQMQGSSFMCSDSLTLNILPQH